MLRLQNIALYQDSNLLLDEVDLSLSGKDRKRVGIIGPNGAGKTTLLNLIMGTHEVFDGIRICEREIIIKVDQTLTGDMSMTAIEYISEALDESWETYKIEKLQLELGVSDELLLQQVSTLSGGEQMKMRIMYALLQDPTILLLDEPTNHLDQVSCEWLMTFIKKFAGSVIIITHDRHVIDNVCNELWDLEPSRQSLRVYGGSFANLLILKDQERENSTKYYEMIRGRADVIRRWLKANEMNVKFRFSNIVASRKKSLERLEDELAIPPIELPAYALPTNKYGEERGELLRIRVDSLVEDRNIHIFGNEIRIKRAQKILISGPNGSGKSTLLSCMADPKFFEGKYDEADDLRIVHLHQHPHFSQKDLKTPLLQLLEFHLPEMTSVYGVALRAGFTKDQLMFNVDRLSEGQKRRLELLMILYEKHDLLLLDEPTNHMDIYMKEEVLRYINTTKITTVMVTHDVYMQEAIKWDQKIVLS